jgi:hypothetical protein
MLAYSLCSEVLQADRSEGRLVEAGARGVGRACRLVRREVVGDVVPVGRPGIGPDVWALALKPLGQEGTDSVGSRSNVGSLVDFCQDLSERPLGSRLAGESMLGAADAPAVRRVLPVAISPPGTVPFYDADLLNPGRSPGSAAVGFQGVGGSLHNPHCRPRVGSRTVVRSCRHPP